MFDLFREALFVAAPVGAVGLLLIIGGAMWFLIETMQNEWDK